MPVTDAINTALTSFKAAGAQTSTHASNIANAHSDNYTKKVTHLTTLAGGGVIASIPQRNVDEMRVSILQTQKTETEFSKTKNQYLQSLEQAMGTPNNKNSTAEKLATFSKNLSSLATTPTSQAAILNVIQGAVNATKNIREISFSVQEKRLQADQNIFTSVEQVNLSLNKIRLLNEDIIKNKAINSATGNLEDSRQQEIFKLSEYMDVVTEQQESGAVFIYTSTKHALVDGGIYQKSIHYNYSSSIDAQSTYPSSIGPILLDGQDITKEINSGRIGALIDLRDHHLPKLQKDMDRLAVTLRDEVNSIHNEGIGLQSPRELQGKRQFTDPFNDMIQATGQFRFAVVDNMTNKIVEEKTTDFSTLGSLSVDNFIKAMTGGLSQVDVTWTPEINNQYSLKINSKNSQYGLSFTSLPRLNENQALESSTQLNIGSYFDWNNLLTTGDRFTQDGNSIAGIAQNLYVRSDITQNSSLFSRGKLNGSLPLAANSPAYELGDGSSSQAISQKLNSTITIPSTDNFPSPRTESIINFAGSILVHQATENSIIHSDFELQKGLLEQREGEFLSQVGVNLYEEVTALIQTQLRHSLSSQVVKTAKEMIQEIIAI